MASKLEQISENEVKITFELDKGRFDEGLEHSYNKNKKRFKIDGFRAGTAPRFLVEKMYGENVLFEDAIDFLLEPTYVEGLKEYKIEPIVLPNIEILEVGGEKGLTFSALITTKPKVVLGDYKVITVEKSKIEVSDEEVDKLIQEEASKNARITTVEGRKTKKGDVVNIDFSGSIDGKLFDGGTAEGYELELGSKSFIDNFEEQLEDKSVGEELVVRVKFPDDYGNESFNGKNAEFKVKMNSISEKVLPEINDEFVSDVSEFSTLAEYKADLKSKLEHQKEHEAKHQDQDALFEKLMEVCQVNIPNAMIEAQVDTLVNRMAQNLRMYGISFEDFVKETNNTEQMVRDGYRKQAEKEVRLALILGEISENEKKEITDQEIDEYAKKMAEGSGRSLEEVKEVFESRKDSIREELKIQKIVDDLVERCVK